MSPPAAEVRWRQASRGVALAGFGVFLLLTTQGVLPWSFWLEAATFWPVLLVAFGLRLLLERSVGAWTALFSPLLVLGTLTFLALREPTEPPPPRGEWRSLEAARTGEAESWVLDASLALGRIDLHSGGVSEGRLLEGRAKGERPPRVYVSERSGEPRVRIRSGRRPDQVVLWHSRARESWELAVADDLPLRADLELAFVEGPIDLSGARLTRLDLEGAFNDVTLSLGAPVEETSIDVEGAFNHFELVVPDTVPLRIDSEGFLNAVADRTPSGAGEGPGYRVRFEGAFNSLTLRSP